MTVLECVSHLGDIADLTDSALTAPFWHLLGFWQMFQTLFIPSHADLLYYTSLFSPLPCRLQ